MHRLADHPAAAWVLAGVAFAVAAAGARPFAAGFNDGSRLATAESLVDRGTFAIDDSPFLGTQAAPESPSPYPTEPPLLQEHGTLDRVRIGEHFYSDKPAVPAVLLAASYRLLMTAGWPRPDARPDVFCRAATVLMCGVSFAAMIGWMWLLGIRAGLSPGWRLLWLGAFAFATVLAAYTRHVNTGVPQAAAVAGLAVFLARIAAGQRVRLSLLGAGSLAGLGYTLDGGSGPLLLLTALGTVVVRTREWRAVAIFLLAALPWVVANHAINYAIGHIWVPLGMVPEYLEWAGSPFDRSNMTGVARHTLSGFVGYAFDLLFGPDGFLVWNQPLVLAVAVGWLVLARSNPNRIEQGALVAWCVAVWLLYAALSDNAGGGCLSVRWLVPCVVPGFWLLATLLVRRPSFRWDFLVLATGGAAVGVLAWPLGPWPIGVIPDVRMIGWLTVGVWANVRIAVWLRAWYRRKQKCPPVLAGGRSGVTPLTR